MDKALVARFMGNKADLEKSFAEKHPESYMDVVKRVVRALEGEADLDPGRIHEINDGDYQGTLVYVIGTTGYHPSDYWYVKVSYGSCSVCDTLKSIRSRQWKGQPNKKQVEEYMQLALHVVQGLKRMGEGV